MYTTTRHELYHERKAWPGTLVDPFLLSVSEYLARSLFCLHPPQRVAVRLDDQSQAEYDFS